MNKMWEEMTLAEKVEDLRRDMKATMAMVNTWIDNQKQLGVFHNELMTKHAATASQVLEAVEALQILRERMGKLP